MKCPRKLYLVVSKKADRDVDLENDLYADPKVAKRLKGHRNRLGVFGATDWRVEVFVKGD